MGPELFLSCSPVTSLYGPALARVRWCGWGEAYPFLIPGRKKVMATLILCLQIVYIIIIILMTIQAIFNIRLLLYIWEKPEQAWRNSAPTIYREPHYSFTIMLPARHEEDVYRETIQKVYDLNYPKRLIQILAICREDDPGTIAEARAKINELRDPNVQLIIFNDKPINKPHGLNLGLRVAKGDIVTIFDA